MFININRDVKVLIIIINGDVLISKGKGVVAIMTKKGKKIIQNVFLVPEISKNLLSVSQMIENGYEVTFKRNSCVIHFQAGRKIVEVQMIKNNFHLKLSSIEEATMLANSEKEKKMQPYKQRYMVLENTKSNLKINRLLKTEVKRVWRQRSSL